MSGTFESLRQGSWITLPSAGNTQVYNASTTQAVANLANFNGYNLCAMRAYVHIMADGANVGILVHSNSTTANALNVTATTGNTACPVLQSGQVYPYRVGVNDTFIGYKTASGTAQLRISVSSPPRRN